VSPPPRPGRLRELGRFLEIQTLALNVPFAIAFVFVAAAGLPRLLPFALVVVAFVAARNAGHAFNRWTDRELDAANPRTALRALPTGRLSPRFALVTTAGSSAVVLVAAWLLNPLALELAPVALALVLGYSYTKRVSSLSTAFLGLVQAVTPAAAFVALDASLPLAALLAVGGVFAWGTAFETVHSLGDLASDRKLGLHSLPARLGAQRSVALVAALHGSALVLLAVFGLAEGLRLPYYLALVAIGIGVVLTDRRLASNVQDVRPTFQRHFLFAALYLAGVAVAVFVPWP